MGVIDGDNVAIEVGLSLLELQLPHRVLPDVNNGKCTASVCQNISDSLMSAVENRPQAKYLAICVPCYNENVMDLMKTFISLMQNVDFMQRTTKLYGDDPGQKLKQIFVNTIPIIVPIFDGTKALSPSMRQWLQLNFKGVLDDLDGPSSPGEIDVRVACGKWWYYPDSSSAGNGQKVGDGITKGTQFNGPRNNASRAARARAANASLNRSAKSISLDSPAESLDLRKLSECNLLQAGRHSISYDMESGRGMMSPMGDIQTSCGDLALPPVHHSVSFDLDHNMYQESPSFPRMDPLRCHSVSEDSSEASEQQQTEGDDRLRRTRSSGSQSRHSLRSASKLRSPFLRNQLTLTGVAESKQGEEDDDEASAFSFDEMYRTHSASSDVSIASTFSVDFDMDEMILFHILPIVKRSNHRKHNSHEWFFNSVCMGLNQRASVVFLTDCGTTYHNACLARLYYELYFKKDLIGVTASQKVETPNDFFHPCEDSPFLFLKGDHSAPGSSRPCWRCYATYICSPCPLQGFEFEATLIMNSAMFNLVEALPVMPGPCQLLDWQKMKKHRVVNAYFNLLFEDENDTSSMPRLPRRLRLMDLGEGEKVSGVAKDEKVVTLTECLRVNMRLAEDRILSFVSIFCTGSGTKWIPDASFCYTPEILWQTLLTQRRRWLNGTFASFLFFFNSNRAKSMIWGGRFDPHKAGNSLRVLNMLWSLQLYQLLLVLISPAIFGCSSYIGLVDCSRVWSGAFAWATSTAFGSVRGAEIWLVLYFAVYAWWTLTSYYHAKMSEWLCQSMVVLGFVFVFPIYLALWTAIIMQGVNIVNGLVIATLLIPVVIASSQSLSSATLYVVYLPWFLFCILFFLVYLPSYSFARLWDTTWGNRAGGSDSAITDGVIKVMKHNNFLFVVFLIVLNVLVTWGLIVLLRFGYSVVLGFMFVVFFPMVIQLASSFLFLFVAIPLRKMTSRHETMEMDFREQGGLNETKGTYSVLNPMQRPLSGRALSDRRLSGLTTSSGNSARFTDTSSAKIAHHCSTSVSGVYHGVNGQDEDFYEKDCDSFEGQSDEEGEEEGMGQEHYV